MARRQKQVLSANVELTKHPKWIPTDRDGQIELSFRLFDDKCWCETDRSLFLEIAKKIKLYEGMVWNEIFARDHRVLANGLIDAARKRLIDLRLDDIDELWRFQLTGRNRLWGLRVRHVFYVLWWDPDHRICPSPLRHT